MVRLENISGLKPLLNVVGESCYEDNRATPLMDNQITILISLENQDIGQQQKVLISSYLFFYLGNHKTKFKENR